MKFVAKKFGVFAILFGLLVTACTDVCSDVELESAGLDSLPVEIMELSKFVRWARLNC